MTTTAIHAAFDRWLDRAGPFTDEAAFEGGDAIKAFLRGDECPVLVVGAGGLGCELLKALALTGFSHLHVIDMDTIDVSNLNRQFLFRAADVGKPKAVVAAEAVMRRIPRVAVTPHYAKIQDKDVDFYAQFALIVLGLDSIEARRWMNATVVGMHDPEDPTTLKPMIDGGTEGFKGHVRVILPRMTPCFECSLSMYPPATTFPMCTIAHTPRLPEHCIAWAMLLQWPTAFPDTQLDGDNPDHIAWVLTTAAARADQYGIRGVTRQLTQGVVKGIIPAIASTNAIVAAQCATEAFKLVTNALPVLKNYMMYMGAHGVYTSTMELLPEPDCPVCGSGLVTLTVPAAATVQDVIARLQDEPTLQLKGPSLRTAKLSVYMQRPAMLEKATRPNLDKPMASFAQQGEEIVVTDTNLPLNLKLKLTYAD